MKKIVLLLALSFCCIITYAQSDTLYTKSRKKIVCKITEIHELDIKYILANNLNGPVFIVSLNSLYKYTLSNGYTELLLPDELSIENEHEAILKNRRVIKINPFCLVNNQISFAFEKAIKVGINLDIEVGYINNSINKNSINISNLFYPRYRFGYYNYQQNPIFYSGAYLKPGIKFFIGQDYSVKGLKYAHPLKGRYIRLELALSYLQFQNFERYDYSSYSWSPPTKTITTNISAFAYGGLVSYGRQFILGNSLTLEYYVSTGFTGRSISYSNPDFVAKGPQNIYNIYSDENIANGITNFHGFQRTPFGLCGTIGFRLGYILPIKKTKRS